MTDCLPVRVVAERLSVSPKTVYRLIADGELEALDVGRRGTPRIRVPESALAAYVERAAIARPA